MTKKIIPLADYITAHDAAEILSAKMGRPIRPGYVHKLKRVRFHVLNQTSKLYHRGDIEACVIRQRGS